MHYVAGSCFLASFPTKAHFFLCVTFSRYIFQFVGASYCDKVTPSGRYCHERLCCCCFFSFEVVTPGEKKGYRSTPMAISSSSSPAPHPQRRHEVEALASWHFYGITFGVFCGQRSKSACSFSTEAPASRTVDPQCVSRCSLGKRTIDCTVMRNGG